VRAPGAPPFRELPDGVNTSQILSPVRLDDHRRVEPGRLFPFPDEELAAVAFESDFDQVRHVRSTRNEE
jgi:hypothetical protein